MKKKFQFDLKVLFFLTSVLSFNWASAELYQKGMPLRCLGMGGTCLTLVKGSQSVFYNPAALARVEGFEFTLAHFSAGLSTNAENYVDAVSNNGGNTITLADLNSLYGKTLVAEVSARGSFAMPYFGVGFYSQNYLLETFNNPTFPTFNVDFISDYGYAVGFAIPLGERTSFGFTGRSAKRWGGNADIDIMSLVNSSNDSVIENTFTNKGTGLGMDISLMTTLPTQLKPTLAIAWYDLGTTQYRKYQGLADPPAQADNLVFGASISHEFLNFDMTYAFEYKFIRTINEDISKKIHLGTEAAIGPLTLRAGLNQGYLSYGLGVDLWIIEVEAAAFTNELGTYAGQNRNERYYVGARISLDFDQSFKLLDANGKKRRLKQRR